MIWLTWRQFRTQAALAFGALASVAVILAVTRPNLVHLFNANVGARNAHGDCSTATTGLLSHYRLLQDLGTVLVAVPAVIGIFWGRAAVARELESGTHRLAWTQSVTRTPLDRREARSDRCSRYGRRRALQPHGDLVVAVRSTGST